MSERLHYLFERYINKTSTASEETELMGLALEEKKQDQLKELIYSVWNEAEQARGMSDEKSEEFLNSIFPKPIIKERRMNWRRIAVAASVLLVVGLGSYLFFSRQDGKSESQENNIVATNDVKAPETNRAMITLADGRRVYLDSVGNGQLAMQGNIKLVKLANGQVAYQTATVEIINELKYNTLNNPRGSKVIDMTLADGSRVWLNAGSSVTYPVAFIGNERKVTITGEAYFEVVHNSSKPFFVSKGDVSVQVLGTHFNVNTYDDEEKIKVTLLEGSVRVQSEAGTRKSEVVLKPGEQAQVGNGIVVKKRIDVDVVMAWKDGRFQFDGAGLEDMMRQIARWYDVEIIYETQAKDLHFTGGISRDVEASKVFKMLETTEAVHFRIEGKRIFVMK